MNLRSNVAFAALLSAGIIALITGKAAQYLVSPKHLEKDAVTVEAAETAGGGAAAAAALPEPILAMIAAADIERGKGVAKACAACHHIEKGGPNGVGPGLYGVAGHQKQSHPGYEYSGTLDDQGGPVWTYEELNKFLWKPKAYAKGTKMTFIGVKKPEDRAALIAYLRTMSDAPPALPDQGQIEQEQKDLAPAAPAGTGGQESATPAAAAPGETTTVKPDAAENPSVGGREENNDSERVRRDNSSPKPVPTTPGTDATNVKSPAATSAPIEAGPEVPEAAPASEAHSPAAH